MQRFGENYRHNTNANDIFEDQTVKTCEEIDMQTQHKTFASDNLNLQMKYGNKRHPNEANYDNDSDVHHGYAPVFSERLKSRMLADNRNGKSEINELMSTIMSKNSIGYYNGGNGEATVQRNINPSMMSNCKSTDTLTAMSKGLTNGSKHWKNLSKRMSVHSTKMLQDESDSNDTDTLNSERHTGSVHYKTSPRTDSASKTSSRSFNDDIYNGTISSPFSVLTKKSSTMLLDSSVGSKQQTKAAITESHFRRVPSSHSNWPQESEINFIMLVGLLLSLTLSKLLLYIQCYCAWFMGQVLRLRNTFLGQNVSIWEFCNFDDTTRYCLRTKLLLLPVVGCCSLLYGLSSLLHSTLRCLLMQAPNSIIIFIQKLYMEP